ncbi:hypothetical protein ACFWXA_29420 [Streptomyces atroolivaceus]|uniref:hypothetical protein n=1 Tax=Streptomyces atroolivaceus TaxID=66869 RepID=UPI00364CB911
MNELAAEILTGTTRQNIANVVVVIVMGLVTLALAAKAARDWRRARRPHLAILLACSVLAAVNDPGARYLCGYRGLPDSPALFSAFGVNITPWMETAFPVYIALGAYVFYRGLENGWTTKRYWTACGIFAGATTAADLININFLHIYHYVGDQPLKIFNTPLVWPLAYAVTSIAIGALLHFLGNQLRGAQWLLALPVLGSGYIGIMAAVSWPSMLLLHSDAAPIAREAGGVVTVACMLATLALVPPFMTAAQAGRLDPRCQGTAGRPLGGEGRVHQP